MAAAKASIRTFRCPSRLQNRGGRLAAGVAVQFAVLALLLTGCRHKPPPPAPAPPKVSVVTVQAQAVPITTELPGRVNGYRTADVRPQVNGIILKRLFVEGRDVKAGQQLYQIDPAPYQALYDSAIAADASARALAERYKPLAEANAVSKQDYDNAVAAHLQAQAAVETAIKSRCCPRSNSSTRCTWT
jgi:membrane fusion protein (multidrug efflux system)